ncbi:MAG: NAD-dependent epimerase/dehydratase family protein, partial [Kiritimatiellae bacterium]|nr:NAD-dependent epimerase/dehydratase family protein [Kiritimatiellia bacterium]
MVSSAESATVWIAGAAGFIGSAITRRFADAGWRVCALIHRRSEGVPDGVHVERCDAADPAALEGLVRRLGQPECVVNAAGLASDVGPRALFHRLNVGIVQALAPLPRRKFIHISSSDVYGIRDFHGETEAALPFDDNVGNPYPATKIEAERWLAAHLPPTRFVCLRPGAVWGEGDRTLEPRAVA